MPRYEARFKLTFNAKNWKEAQKLNIAILDNMQELMRGHVDRRECLSLKEVDSPNKYMVKE